MEAAYPRFKLSSAQRRLMDAWDRQYPVTPFECLKTKRIQSIQKNINEVVKSRCEASGFW
jgi:deoxyribonuclease-1